jgi:hypothetical protein
MQGSEESDFAEFSWGEGSRIRKQNLDSALYRLASKLAVSDEGE